MTKGQVQDAITKQANSLYKDLLGTGPKNLKTYIVEDMVIVRVNGKLLPFEQRLLEGKGGVEMVKDIRKALHEATTQKFSQGIENLTGKKVISSHSDVSTKTGEIVKIFILDKDLENELGMTQTS
jgi:uncharacterized protein YbcI